MKEQTLPHVVPETSDKTTPDSPTSITSTQTPAVIQNEAEQPTSVSVPTESPFNTERLAIQCEHANPLIDLTFS